MGWNDDVIAPILSLRVVAGAVGILSLFLLMWRYSENILVAALVCLGVASSAAYWTYSSRLDQSISFVALSCVAFFLAVRGQTPPRKRSMEMLLPVTLAGATLYNFTAVILSAIILVYVAVVDSRESWGGRLRRLTTSWLIYGVIVVGAVAVAVAVAESPSQLAEIDYWREVSFSGHPEYQTSLVRDGFRAALGLGKAQVAYPGAAGSLQEYWDSVSGMEKVLLLGFYTVLLAWMALPAAYLVSQRRRLGSHAKLVALMGMIFISYAAFDWWWDPGYIKYWLIPIVAWWVIAGIAILHASDRYRHRYRLITSIALAFVIASALVNALVVFAPKADEDDNTWLATAQSLQGSASDALFISVRGHPLDFYIAYFSRRDIVSADLVRYGTGGDEQQVRDVVLDHIEQHRAVGGPVYVYGVDDAEEAASLDFIPSSGIRIAWSFPDVTIYELLPERE
jgi:hypothetical protein